MKMFWKTVKYSIEIDEDELLTDNQGDIDADISYNGTLTITKTVEIDGQDLEWEEEETSYDD
jgi:hypothetical protein